MDNTAHTEPTVTCVGGRTCWELLSLLPRSAEGSLSQSAGAGSPSTAPAALTPHGGVGGSQLLRWAKMLPNE